MKRKLALLLAAASLAALLCGCSLTDRLLGLVPEKIKDKLGLNNKEIVCLVESMEDKQLTVVVVSPDSHFDESDELIVDYDVANGIRPGDAVTFTYDYLNDVTSQGKYARIRVGQVIETTYTPPPTTESTAPSEESDASLPPESTVPSEPDSTAS